MLQQSDTPPIADTAAVDPLIAWARNRRGRVLVVDDSATNRLLTAMLLSRAGFEVALACDGNEAVSAVREAVVPPEAVLMDVAMPEMDGVTATATIRQMEGERARIPIIAVTSQTYPEDRSRCFAVGMNDFVEKPVARADLLAALRRWMPPSPSDPGARS